MLVDVRTNMFINFFPDFLRVVITEHYKCYATLTLISTSILATKKKHITLIKSFRTPTFCRRMPFQKYFSVLRMRIITRHVYITEVISQLFFLSAPKISPQNVTANFDNQNNEVVLNWRSSLQDIEGFRVSKAQA